MKTQKSRILGIVYSLITFAVAIVGFYLLVHFVPEIKSQKFGDLNILTQIVWAVISTAILFKFLPDKIKWNAYYWLGVAIIIAAMTLLADNVPKIAIQAGIAGLDPITGAILMILGAIFILKGYLAYEET